MADTVQLPVPKGYSLDSSGNLQPTATAKVNLPAPRKPFGFWHNVGAGVANQIISGVNTGIRGSQDITRRVLGEGGADTSQLKPAAQIRKLAHDPGLEYEGGKVLSNIPLYATGEGGLAKLGAKAIEYAPKLEKIPSMVGKMLKSGGAGAGTTYVTADPTQDKPGMKALESAIPNALLPVGGAIMSKALSIPKKYLIQSGKNVMGKIVKPLASHISNEFNKHLAGVNPEHLLEQAYESAKAKAGDFSTVAPQAQALDKTLGMQSKADLIPGQETNNFPKYNAELDSQLAAAKTNAQQGSRWNTAVGKIQALKDKAPNNFNDAQAQAKEINNMGHFGATSEVNPDIQGSLRQGINPLHSALHEDVSDLVAKSNHPNAQKFLDNWDMQRANYAKFKGFHNNPSSDIGSPSSSSGIEADLENKDYGKVLSKYVPKADEGFNKIERLQNLTGNGDMANKAVLSKFLEKYTIPGQQSYNIEKLAKDIHSNKVSPAVAALMPGHLKVGLGNIIKGQKIAQDLKDNPTLLHSATKHRFTTGFLSALLAHGMGAGSGRTGMAGVMGMVAPGMIEGKLAKHYLEQAEHHVNQGDMSKLEEMLNKEQEPAQDVSVISPRAGKNIRQVAGAAISNDPSLPLGGLASLSFGGNNHTPYPITEAVE